MKMVKNNKKIELIIALRHKASLFVFLETNYRTKSDFNFNLITYFLELFAELFLIIRRYSRGHYYYYA